MEKLLSWWVTQKLPKQHYKKNCDNLTCLFKTWVIHPIKRRLAKLYLTLLKYIFNTKIIGITGSAGKTTIKEMLASVLKEESKTMYSKDNIDPVFNIPSTILKSPLKTKYLVLEMGVEYPGEMDYYLWFGKPDYAIISNIYPTHTQFFKNEKGVAFEKGKLAKNLNEKATVVLNSQNKYSKQIAKSTKAKIVWFGKSSDPESLNKECVEILSKQMGISDTKIRNGIRKYKKPKHRLSLSKNKNGVYIFDDSYNSNPEAFLSALKVFLKKAKKNKKIAIVGDMLELGGLEMSSHKKIGKELAKNKFDLVIGIGEAVKTTLEVVKKISPSTQAYLTKDQKDVKQYLKPYLKKNSYVFIKGSRSLQLDKLADSLL